MKFAGLCLLAILFAPISVQAEMIEPISMTTEFGAAGTTAQVYVKVVFLKRNSGTPITGLTTTNIRPFLMTEKTLNPWRITSEMGQASRQQREQLHGRRLLSGFGGGWS